MMSKKILLINGWGGLIQALQPLKQALQNFGHHVDIIDYVDVQNPHILKEYSIKIAPYDVIAGWSLGGQVATVLLHHYYQLHNNAQPKILWTLFSNPCFIVKQNWKYAQTEHDFFIFEQSFVNNPKLTLNRFLRNIVANDKENRALYQQFIQHQQDYFQQDGAYQHLLMGLDLLKDLDNLHYLNELDKQGIRHICFLAEQDTLAPHRLSTPLMMLGSNFNLTLEWIGLQHHFSLYTQAEKVASHFEQCINE